MNQSNNSHIEEIERQKNDRCNLDDGRHHFGDFYFCCDTGVVAAKKRRAGAMTFTAFSARSFTHGSAPC